jgi:hypothetical protein
MIPQEIVLESGVVFGLVIGRTWASMTKQVEKDGNWSRFIVYEEKKSDKEGK